MSVGGLAFVGFVDNKPRKSILRWLGVDPETSNAGFGEALKRVNGKTANTNKFYFQLVVRPRLDISVDYSVLDSTGMFLSFPGKILGPRRHSATTQFLRQLKVRLRHWLMKQRVARVL